MERGFMNTENSDTNESNNFFYEFTDKLKNPNKNIALVNSSICYTWKDIKSAYNNKISSPSWNDKFRFPGGLYSISEIQNYFECIIKNHETIADNSPVQIYIKRIKNRI